MEESKRIPYLMLAHAAKVDIQSTIQGIDGGARPKRCRSLSRLMRLACLVLA